MIVLNAFKEKLDESCEVTVAQSTVVRDDLERIQRGCASTASTSDKMPV